MKFSPPFYDEEEVSSVAACIQNRWTGTGEKVIEFEKIVAEKNSFENAIALSSCTSALFLSLKALGIGEGDEVITTPMTFCSTVNVILHVGAKPVLCDIDKLSKNINPEKIEEKINKRTKAIIPVHYRGLPCEMDKIMDIANKNNIYVIEDCAHAFESFYKGKRCGSFGIVGCYSFYATKNIAIGEGGMVVTNNSELARKIRIMSLHGLSKDAWKRFLGNEKRSYDVVDIGYKFNMTDIQAAIGICQLKKLDKMKKIRARIWEIYMNSINKELVDLPSLPDKNSFHSKHLFNIGLPENIDRDQFIAKAKDFYDTLFGIHYKSIPSFSIYKELKLFENSDELKNANDWGKRNISLSLSAGVTEEEIEKTINTLNILLLDS